MAQQQSRSADFSKSSIDQKLTQVDWSGQTDSQCRPVFFWPGSIWPWQHCPLILLWLLIPKDPKTDPKPKQPKPLMALTLKLNFKCTVLSYHPPIFSSLFCSALPWTRPFIFQVSSSRTSVTSNPPLTYPNFFMPHSQQQPQASLPLKPVFPLIASPSDLLSPSMTSHPSLAIHMGAQQLNDATSLAPNPLSPLLSPPYSHSLSVSLFFQHSHSLSTLHFYMQRSQ